MLLNTSSSALESSLSYKNFVIRLHSCEKDYYNSTCLTERFNNSVINFPQLIVKENKSTKNRKDMLTTIVIKAANEHPYKLYFILLVL
jgi:hypothetical protein